MSNMNRVLVYDGPNDKSMLIGGLLGTSKHNVVKSISSSGNSMFLKFKKEDVVVNPEFSASIYYNKISNTNCPSWTDFSTSGWMSSSHSNIDCSWLITRQFGSYLTLKLRNVEVKSVSKSNKFLGRHSLMAGLRIWFQFLEKGHYPPFFESKCPFFIFFHWHHF